MFSFHKPKVYRSPTGCCICKAKSSSSRFTDSRKYEDDFVECFQLPSPRKGEICNACVLLVKRFKRLPPGSDRHWGHVVDARVGPGLKSMTRFKKKKEEKELAANSVGFNSSSNAPPEKFLKIMKKKSKKMREEQKNRENSPSPSDDSTPGSPLSYHSDADDNLSDVDCNTNGQLVDDEKNIAEQGKENNAQNVARQRRKGHKPSKRKAGPPDCGSFLQSEYWSSVKICCGVVFRGAGNELAIDIKNYKPCSNHQTTPKRQKTTTTTTSNNDTIAAAASATTKDNKVYSDNSSDSGYDEYSSNLEKNKENTDDAARFNATANGKQQPSAGGASNVGVQSKVTAAAATAASAAAHLNFVINGTAVKVSPGNIIKQNSIVVIKPKKQVVALGSNFIVKSPATPQVQQAAN